MSVCRFFFVRVVVVFKLFLVCFERIGADSPSRFLIKSKNTVSKFIGSFIGSDAVILSGRLKVIVKTPLVSNKPALTIGRLLPEVRLQAIRDF